MGLNRILTDEGQLVYTGKPEVGKITNTINEDMKFELAEKKKEIIELKEHKQELLDQLKTAIVQKKKVEEKFEKDFDLGKEAQEQIDELKKLNSAYIGITKKDKDTIAALKKEAEELAKAEAAEDAVAVEALKTKDKALKEKDKEIAKLEKDVEDLKEALDATSVVDDKDKDKDK